MTVARIPFSPDDESAIRTLVGTMMFLLVVHFVVGGVFVLGGCLTFMGVPAQFNVHPAAGLGSVLTGLSVFVMGVGMIGQGVLLVQIRRSLDQLVSTDSQDQALMADAFAKLKWFFLAEALLIFVGMGATTGGFLTQAFGPAIGAMGGGM